MIDTREARERGKTSKKKGVISARGDGCGIELRRCRIPWQFSDSAHFVGVSYEVGGSKGSSSSNACEIDGFVEFLAVERMLQAECVRASLLSDAATTRTSSVVCFVKVL